MEDKSVWKGSMVTALDIAHQIKQRWGEEEVKNYDPNFNCFTLPRWNQEGYRVKKGEKSLHTCTFVRSSKVIEDQNGSKEVKYYSYPKTVHLFYYLQVQKKGQ